MIPRGVFRGLALALCLMPPVRATAQQDSVRLTGSYSGAFRPGLWVLGGPGLDSVRAIVDRDLLHSDRFEMTLSESASRLTGPFNAALYKGSKVTWVVELQPNGDAVELKLHDIGNGTVRQQASYLVDRRGAGDARLAIHRISDEIVKWTTGGLGIAATRILYQQNPMGDPSAGLYRIDADGQNRVKIPTGGWPISPAWSPNGAQVAYAELSTESVWNIVILTLATGNRARIPKRAEDRNASYSHPVFSPDMRDLYFTRTAEGAAGEIYRADVSNLSSICCVEPRTTSGRNAVNVRPTVSPDGSAIAFETTRVSVNQIYRMDADGTQPVTLLSEGSTKFHAPAWSPDGTRIAFEKENENGVPQIWVMEVASGRQKAFTSRDRNEWPSWAPDSRHLIFRSNRSGRDRLYVLDTESVTLRAIDTPGGGARYPAWSPILGGTNPYTAEDKMTVRSLATALLGMVLFTSACSKKPPVIEPTAPSTGSSGGQQPATPGTNPVTPPVTPPPATPAGPTTAELRGTLADRIHFDYDQAVVLGEDAPRLDRKVAILRANPTLKIRIIGHCDERGSDAYNIALGMRRAAAAKDYLVKAGIDASRIDIASLGREAPIDNSGTEEGMRLNRRGEFEVTAGPTTLVSP